MEQLFPLLTVGGQLLSRGGLEGFVSTVAQSDVTVALHDADQRFGGLVMAELAQGPRRCNPHVQRLLFLQVGPLSWWLTNDSGQQLDRCRVPRFAQGGQRLTTNNRGRLR